MGTWNATLVAGYTPVTWYATVAVGALVGNYAFGVSLTEGNTLAPILVSVLAPESHGEQPPDVGDDITAPVVTLTPLADLGSTASFEFTADEVGVTFECELTTTGVAGGWEACKSPTTYTDLEPTTYTFPSMRRTRWATSRSTSPRAGRSSR